MWTLPRLFSWLIAWPMLACCAAALLGLGALPAQAEPSFLAPDQAFKLSARAADSRTVELHFEVADGYYIYRERLAVEVRPATATLAALSLPPGKVKYDETFQKDVETYRQSLRIPVVITAAPARLQLLVSSQGCADAGLCYPPRQQVVDVRLSDGAITQAKLLVGLAEAEPALADGPVTPLLAAASVVAETNSGDSSSPVSGGALAWATADDAVTNVLRNRSLWAVVAVFFVAGALLSLTPCVLPMLPILSSIIVGQGGPVSRWRGFSLALAYALGMALIYTALGVAAGLAGQGLAAALQSPWTLSLFALLLVALALSMFGFYELQLPAGLRDRMTGLSSRLPGGRYAGVFAMGGLSALMVSPCVAAPLAAALLYISQSRDVWLGGLALFALACGMSLPLLLIGLSAGSLLPRAGAWMEGVKRFFGALLLAVAWWMVAPVLPPAVSMGLLGTGLLAAAVFLRSFDALSPSAGGGARLLKTLGLLLALAGAAQWVGLMAGGRNPWKPLSPFASSTVSSTAPSAEGLRFEPLRSVAELDELLAQTKQPVMLDFYADWCVSCKEMEAWTFTDPRVQQALQGVRLLKADVTANTPQDQALLQRFSLFGPPGIIFFNAQGQEQVGKRVVGYQNAERFLQSLRQALP